MEPESEPKYIVKPVAQHRSVTPVEEPVKRTSRRRRQAVWTFLKRSVGLGAMVGYLGGMTALGIVAMAGWDLPSVESLSTPNRPVSIQFVDRLGRDIMVRGAHAEHFVAYEDMPDHLVAAILATEDRRFFHHTGVDPIGLARALQVNWTEGRYVQGGSTLSQQLVKNVFLTPERAIKRKVQEAMLSVWLEQKFSKSEILEKYINRVYFGSGTWGVEAAAQTYFQRGTSDLTLPESALLVGLLKAPSRLNPVSNPDRAGDRTAVVLRAMEDAGYIDRSVRRQALLQPVSIRPPKRRSSVNYFIDWIWSDIEDAIGVPGRDIVVQTTLDAAAQAAADAAIAAHLDPESGARQAAVLMIDGRGGVRTMVGGTRYDDSEFNRVTQASRQPGSAFKAFVYLAAFESGKTPWDWSSDEPIKIGDWEPGNFSNTFEGVMQLERAFAKSINTVAVKLSEEVGRERVIETASALGFEDLQPLRSLPLGAQNTTLMALTSAYLPFANWGNKVEPQGILSISTADGILLYEFPNSPPQRIVSSIPLGHINRVMRQTVEVGTGRAARVAGWDVAGKTGTTNDYRDAWFMGYVPDLVTGVWVGNDENEAMKRMTGGKIPARIWRDMMTEVLKTHPNTELPVSEPRLRADTQNTLDILLDDLETALP